MEEDGDLNDGDLNEGDLNDGVLNPLRFGLDLKADPPPALLNDGGLNELGVRLLEWTFTPNIFRGTINLKSINFFCSPKCPDCHHPLFLCLFLSTLTDTRNCSKCCKEKTRIFVT